MGLWIFCHRDFLRNNLLASELGGGWCTSLPRFEARKTAWSATGTLSSLWNERLRLPSLFKL